MRCNWKSLIGCALLGLVMILPSVRADDEKVPLDKVPAQIMTAVKGRFPGSTLTSVTKEKANNEVVFDVELKHEGRKYEMDIKENGTILEIEKQVDQKDLPAVVAKALEDKYPKATIEEIMEVNKVTGKEEKPDHYEITITTADKKKLEVEVSLDGKKVEAPAADKK
jgi:Putative beta-lactamase-inhibitor-like, PepSY-like